MPDPATWLDLRAEADDGAGPGALDGRRARTAAEFHATAAAALGFPDWYGHNWDAFEECLADRSPAVTELTIRHAEHLLDREPPGALETLLSIVRARAGAAPLTVVLSCSPEGFGTFVERVRAALREQQG